MTQSNTHIRCDGNNQKETDITQYIKDLRKKTPNYRQKILEQSKKSQVFITSPYLLHA